jgi:K+-sensing histidine kinase KdpD
MEMVNLSFLVEDVISEFVRKHPSLRVNFEIENHVLLKGEYAQLKKSVQSLIDGALRYTEKTTQPVIVFGHVEDQQIFLVIDGGNGFKMQMENVNDRFFFHSPYSRKQNESKVKRMMVKRGGRVWGSGEESIGAVFRWFLN